MIQNCKEQPSEKCEWQTDIWKRIYCMHSRKQKCIYQYNRKNIRKNFFQERHQKATECEFLKKRNDNKQKEEVRLRPPVQCWVKEIFSCYHNYNRQRGKRCNGIWNNALLYIFEREPQLFVSPLLFSDNSINKNRKYQQYIYS